MEAAPRKYLPRVQLNQSSSVSSTSSTSKVPTFVVIDLVLVYKNSEDEEKRKKRSIFQDNLIIQGLRLLEEKGKTYEEDGTVYVKVNAPFSTLSLYADEMNLKKSVNIQAATPIVKKENGNWRNFMKPKLSSLPRCLMATFREDIAEVFIKDKESENEIFTSAERSEIVWNILQKTNYGDDDKLGIGRLLSNDTYIAAYPLHDGPFIKNNENSSCICERQQLYQEWARPGAWYKEQPLDNIRKYFGDEVGLYFAWLGFYTKMLIPASLVGLACFIYGLATMFTDLNMPSKEICNTSTNSVGSYSLCPRCLDGYCSYDKLGDSCIYSQLNYLFDNPATVAFAIFMSFWATMFLELWKRRQARLISRWGMSDAQMDLETRPEFEISVSSMRVNKLTGKMEPFLPMWSRIVRITATVSGVAFMVAIVIIAILGIIVYKIAIVSAFYGINDDFVKDNSRVLTSITGAIINLIVIVLLNQVYQRIARWLTDVECPRTQHEYDDSYTFKIFAFEFLNCYSSLFYIAFFRGKFYTYPGDDHMWQTFLGIGGDTCDPAGCISELFIQLTVVMVGKQILNNIKEIIVPIVINWWTAYRRRNTDDVNTLEDFQWEQDFCLYPTDGNSLFSEILEMVLQYGFLTLFVAAFPLAPLFALLNNIVEIRLDAFKLITKHRRPVSKKVASLGAWFSILQALTYLAVVTNAFVISYTADFIPRTLYQLSYSQDGSLSGYVNFTLSVFAVSDYNLPNEAPGDGICRYPGYRNPPTDEYPYDVTYDFWHILAARLAFVVVFEHVVMGLSSLLAYAIPDLPWDVKEKMSLEEKLLIKETQLCKKRKFSKFPV